MHTVTRTTTLAALAMIAAVSRPAAAQQEDAAATYQLYHAALEAARMCQALAFGESEHARLAAAINGLLPSELGTARLRLLTGAQIDARQRVRRGGCGDPDVAALITLYERDLAPALD